MIMQRNLEQSGPVQRTVQTSRRPFLPSQRPEPGRSLRRIRIKPGGPADLEAEISGSPGAKGRARPLDPVSQLRAENQALRDEILHLKVQWEVLKTTLGILSANARPEEKPA